MKTQRFTSPQIVRWSLISGKRSDADLRTLGYIAPKAFQTLQGWAEWTLARQDKIVPVVLFALWLHCTTLEFASSESKKVKRETYLKKKKAKQRQTERVGKAENKSC